MWGGFLLKTINLPPYAPTLMASTRAVGYSLEAAVADVVDNSIAAYATDIDIFFFPVNGAHIAILDNGTGMDSDEINIAMQYGSKNPNELRDAHDLGRFGLGLKTASLSQCKTLTVISKKNGLLNGRRWDLDHVTETGAWSLIVLDEEEMKECIHFDMLDEYDSGTLVIWEKLDRFELGEINLSDSMSDKMFQVQEHLSLVYHRYLTGEAGISKVNMKVNGARLAPVDPFLVNKSTCPIEDEVLLIRDERILVRPYILPHTSQLSAEELEELGGKDGLTKSQGFYVYRNKRLLVWGTWFRMHRKGDLSKLVRIQVDIPNSLDDLWTLDIKKSSAIPPAEVRRNLKALIERMAENSHRTWTFRGKKETDSKIVHAWSRLKTRDGSYRYEINREYPLVKQLIEQFSGKSNEVELLLRRIEEGLPLNQLYVDLTGDEKIENDKELTINKILTEVKEFLGCYGNLDKSAIVGALVQSSPYNEFRDEIMDALSRGDL